jgi:hypothetical protein
MFARLAVGECFALAGTVGEVGVSALGGDRYAVGQFGDDSLSALDARDRFVDRRDPALVRCFRLRYFRRLFDLVDFHRRSFSVMSNLKRVLRSLRYSVNKNIALLKIFCY